MALKIIWTENAGEDYKKIIEYLLKEWSVDIAAKFIDILESRLEALSIFPNILVSHLQKKIKSELSL